MQGSKFLLAHKQIHPTTPGEGGGRVANRRREGWGFSGPKDTPDTDGQPYLTMQYTSYGLHEI